MQKTKVEIIRETVDYYSQDTTRRSYDAERDLCCYLGEDGRKCSVGRCIIPEILAKRYHELNQRASVENIPDLEEILQPEYRGHSLEFWKRLQVLHDDDKYWTPEGLSEKGEHKVAELITVYDH